MQEDHDEQTLDSELLECTECHTELERFQAVFTEDATYCVVCLPDNAVELEFDE